MYIKYIKRRVMKYANVIGFLPTDSLKSLLKCDYLSIKTFRCLFKRKALPFVLYLFPIHRY